MTQVDFYILPDHKLPERFACDLAEKARKQGLQIYIHTESKQAADRLNDLLWTHKDISFLPHDLIDVNDLDGTPITIGWVGSEPGTDEVLINLSSHVPEFAKSFTRIIEIVAGQEPIRNQARERYRHYRDQNFDLHSHNLESNNAYT